MIKRVRFILEYGTHPIWLYDENDFVISRNIPNELCADEKMIKRFLSIQKRYEEMIMSNPHDFSNVGFKSTEDEIEFNEDCRSAIRDFVEILNGKYEIEDDITPSLQDPFEHKN